MNRYFGNHKIGKARKPKNIESREIRKQVRLDFREEQASEVLALIGQGYAVERINGPYQWRVNGQLDIYPKGKKYCDVRHGVWGSYNAGELLAFVLNFPFEHLQQFS